MTLYPHQERSKEDVKSGAEIDFKSGAALKINGTAVTATAAEINAQLIAGITATGADLNILAGFATKLPVMAAYHKATAAEVKAGHEILPAIVGKSYKILGAVMQALGGAATTSTSVDIKDSDETAIIAFPVALLAQGKVVDSGSSNTITWADISLAQTANKGIIVEDTAKNSLTVATHIAVIVYYTIV